MKNIVIILGLTAVLGAAGFIGTAVIAQKHQAAQRKKQEHAVSEEVSPESLQESNRRLGDAVSGLNKRQRYAVIGGGVGAALGFALGLFIVVRQDRRKKASDNATVGGRE